MTKGEKNKLNVSPFSNIFLENDAASFWKALREWGNIKSVVLGLPQNFQKQDFFAISTFLDDGFS